MLVDFQHHYTPPELMETGKGNGTHAIGAVLLFVAAKQTKFWGLFLTMLLYSICYTATLPLVNKLLFSNSPT